MFRSIFFTLVATLCFGCASAASNTVRTEPAADKTEETLDWAHETHSAPKCMSPAGSKYVCDASGVYSGSDVSTYKGYHVIEFVKDSNGVTFAHVADTCQHYFCAVEVPESNGRCMAPRVKTVGCCLAFPVESKDPSNK